MGKKGTKAPNAFVKSKGDQMGKKLSELDQNGTKLTALLCSYRFAILLDFNRQGTYSDIGPRGR